MSGTVEGLLGTFPSCHLRPFVNFHKETEQTFFFLVACDKYNTHLLKFKKEMGTLSLTNPVIVLLLQAWVDPGG